MHLHSSVDDAPECLLKNLHLGIQLQLGSWMWDINFQCVGFRAKILAGSDENGYVPLVSTKTAPDALKDRDARNSATGAR